MDHHGDWDQWHDNPSDGDTADLGGEHLDDLGHHDLGDHDAYPEHDGYDGDGYAEAPDVSHLSHGPDLVHEGGQDDFGQQHDLVDDYGTGHDEPGLPDHLVGADPDLPPDPHTGWHDGDFPPALDLDGRPEPADGYPWADPDTLGDPGHDYGLADADHGYGSGGTAPPGDLYAYAGLDAPGPGVDPWAQLYGSDDPATGTLARFWGPTG